MDFQEFCVQYNVSIGDDKHQREGWINIQCPFCGDTSFHLGFNLERHNFSCYRCGRKDGVDVIRALAHCDKAEAVRIMIKLRGGKAPPRAEKPNITIRTHAFHLPVGTGPLQDVHRQYLRGRGYNDRHLEQTWNLLATPHYGDYKFRICAPVYFQQKMVSYQCRDITGKSELRYKACELKDEIIHHKDIVYGMDRVEGNSVIIVEGITSVWRLDRNTVATFGASWTMSQINLLRRFKRRFILYDNDDAGYRSGGSLGMMLSSFAGETEIIGLDSRYKDPAELPQEEADELVHELTGG